MTYLWLKAFHIIAVVCWFAGLFYLPRLFVYHAMTPDKQTQERFKVMERKLYRGIMNPAMWVSLLLGLGMMHVGKLLHPPLWLTVKLGLVVLLIGYHHMCGSLMKKFQRDENQRSHIWYRYFNEVPTLLLIAVVLLVVLKPF